MSGRRVAHKNDCSPFDPPTDRFGGYSDEHGVYIFVSALLLEYCLEYFDDTSKIVKQVMTCRVQKGELSFYYF